LASNAEWRFGSHLQTRIANWLTAADALAVRAGIKFADGLLDLRELCLEPLFPRRSHVLLLQGIDACQPPDRQIEPDGTRIVLRGYNGSSNLVSPLVQQLA
jgi:hypothetical protein